MNVIAVRLAQLRSRLESAAFLVSKGGSDQQVHSELVQAIVTLAEIERSCTASPAESDDFDKQADEASKVRNRLRLWARPDRQGQINSRILNAYLRLEKSMPVVTEADIRNQLPDIKSFDGNFAQMKTVAEKNHGKIFEQNGSAVSIWEPVLTFVRDYERSRDILMSNSNRGDCD